MYYRRLMLEAESNADNDLLTPSQRKQAQKDYHNYRRLHESTRFLCSNLAINNSSRFEDKMKPIPNLKPISTDCAVPRSMPTTSSRPALT